MRRLTNFDTLETARKLQEVLYAQDVKSEVRDNNDGTFSIWIYSEDQIENAHAVCNSFKKDPKNVEYESLLKAAQNKRKEEAIREKQSRHKSVDVRTTWRASTAKGPLTLTLAIICVGIALITEMGERNDLIRYLTISDYAIAGSFLRHAGLSNIASGEIWRLFTPALLHFSFIHIFFNIWWLFDLGSAIENRRGSWYLGLLILAISGVSNFAQFMVTKSPLFGGMSGVVYGLLGYIWMLGKFKPSAGLFVPRPIVIFMLVWLVLGFTGFFGLFGVGIANIVHLAGLAVGALWGYLESGDLMRRVKR
ncbi:MAG: rhomboid family intramembrane serine protease [Deltaproteobacteria bacterium]|nr:rhomboid family intramembrane serine protease [Deltaproteobacteria bacterium]